MFWPCGRVKVSNLNVSSMRLFYVTSMSVIELWSDDLMLDYNKNYASVIVLYNCVISTLLVRYGIRFK